MTFVLNNRIVCVGKWAVEKQNTGTNKRLHCLKDECILYAIVSSTGEHKKLATLHADSFEQINLAVKKHWSHIDLRQYDLDSAIECINKNLGRD